MAHVVASMDAAGAESVDQRRRPRPHERSGKWIAMSTDKGPAVAFETHLKIVEVRREQIQTILDPEQWVTFQPPWSSMSRLPSPDPAMARFLEVFTLNDTQACERPYLTLRTVLDFKRTMLPNGSGLALEYRLCEDQISVGGDGRVTVDEGSLVMQDRLDAVYVIATKRIQFPVFASMTLDQAARTALLAERLGLGRMPCYFVERVAGVSAGQVSVVSPFELNIRGHLADEISQKPRERNRRDRSWVFGEYRDLLRMSSSWVAARYENLNAQLVGDRIVPNWMEWCATATFPLRAVFTGVDNEAREWRYSDVFSMPPTSVDRILHVSVLTPGIPRRRAVDEVGGHLVSVIPTVLKAGQSSFQLAIDLKQLVDAPGGLYRGEVCASVSPASADRRDAIAPVWIVIP